MSRRLVRRGLVRRGGPLPELHLGTVSDSTGRFVLSVPVSGRFVVSSPGSATKAGSCSCTWVRMTRRHDVHLVRRTLELRQASGGTQVLAPERWTAAWCSSTPGVHPTGALSLSDAIATLPGVSQLTTGPGISKPVVRGLSGNRVQVNMLGQRFDNQQWQDEHGLGLSDLGIEERTGDRGAGRAAVRQRCRGGVVNVREEALAPVGTRIQEARLGCSGNTGGISVSYGMRRTANGTGGGWRRVPIRMATMPRAVASGC